MHSNEDPVQLKINNSQNLKKGGKGEAESLDS